jgi:hypothetical protein
MNFKIAITFLLWITIITPLFLSMVSADEDITVSEITRDSASMFDDGEVLQHAGNLRKKEREAKEDKGFTLWSWDQITEIVPQEFFQYKNAWPVMVATVSDGASKLTYYTAPMPSGVMPDQNYFLNFGKKYDNLDALNTDLSSLATNYDDSIEPNKVFGGIPGGTLRNLIYDWGIHESSRGNCYRYAANDRSTCPYQTAENSLWDNEHQESPGDYSWPLPYTTACYSLLTYAKNDGMINLVNGDCPFGQMVALAVASGTPAIKDYHWYRRTYRDSSGVWWWTHKPGYTMVRDFDASGKPITNPQYCNRNNVPLGGSNYNLFCGYLCVPNYGTINLDKNNAADKPPCQT